MPTILADTVGLSFCSLWISALIYMWWSVVRLPRLRFAAAAAAGEANDWPTVCAVIPACNEAGHLEAALGSLLEQDYPGLTIVVVDDRSTDSTPEIIHRIAASDSRVRSMRIESLPDGWLGKVHALHRGVREANADWYLFTDADVYFEPAMLRQAIAHARQNRLTHLTAIPEIPPSSAFWLDVTIRSFFLMFSVATRLATVNRTASKWPVGIGAFNLVEARIFGRTPGFEWLRMEPADDLGLAAMVKAAGAKSQVVHGEGMLRVSWYASMHEMFRGLEKNSFGPAANYRYWRQLAIVLLLCLFALVPPMSLAAGLYRLDPVLAGAGSLAVVASAAVSFVVPRRSPREFLAGLLLPAGVLIMAAIMIRAAYLCWRNDGIAWRGTHYRIEELRSGQRVRF